MDRIMTPTEFRAARDEMGLTPAQMGAALGYAASGANVRISEIENGARVPRQAAILMALLLRLHRTAPHLLPDGWPHRVTAAE